ncbi:MAG TPA: BatA domain-containing protein, partial [Gemmataceae bacterium]|nr:BatA domain-containing protein [Gemmataceae bacterium]
MTFIHPLLLGGLALVGIPILLHLIMRQKPKHLFFPALRFLLQQHRTNQRKLRLRHLLLLALRMLLLAAMCLALARPKIFSERLLLTTDRPVAAVLLFDTSPSMEYTAGGRTRLDEAKRRSQELLESLPQGSRVAILDTAEQGGEWLQSLSQARERIGSLEIRPNSYPVTSQIIPAYDLLGKLAEEIDNPDEAPRGALYVFSDRTLACWNTNQIDQLQRRRDQLPPPGISAMFLDVGVENPASVALTNVEVPNQVVAGNKPVVIRAMIKSIGMSCDTEVVCKIGTQDPGERKPITLEPGQSRVLTFERRGLPPGMHQAEIALATKGALPFANLGYATFEVQGPREVLVVADDPANARILKLALQTKDAFQCDVKSTGEARKLFPQELATYRAICLVGLSKPDFTLWERLEEYVKRGGGLAVIPGEQETDPSSYNMPAAQKLLPGRLGKAVLLEKNKPEEKGAVWSAATYQHPVMAPFGEWSKNETVDFLQPGSEPEAFGFWEIDLPKNQDAYVVVSYGEKKPALIER